MLGLKQKMMPSHVPTSREIIGCHEKNREFESGTSGSEPQHGYLLTWIHGHDLKLSRLQFPSLLNVTNNTYITGLFHIYVSVILYRNDAYAIHSP